MARALRVPLATQTLRVLAAARDLTTGGPDDLLFPALLEGVMRDSTLATLPRRLGLGTVHGLRSAFRSWCSERGVDHGDTGEPGIDTLTARGTDALVVLINDGENAQQAAVIGSLPDPIDMTTHFRGGYEPITYSTSMETGSTSTFTGEIDKDTGVLTIKLRDATDTDPAGQYELNTTATEANAITVTATDDEGNTATKMVNVLTNKAPVGDTPGTAWGVNVGTEVRADKEVVACLATPAAADDANTIHRCTVEGAGSGIFTDDNTNDFVLSVMSTSSKATVTADGKTLTITGLESTWDTDLDPDAHTPAEVTIRATEQGRPVRRADVADHR